MAFVPLPPLGASVFKGTKPHAALVRSPLAAPRVAASRAPLRMAFSSIDTPEASVAQRDFSIESKADILTALYRHVFGNAYLMHSEREEFAIMESDFKNGRLSVREVVRRMAKSVAYRKRYFERCGPYRFIELNCKHLLGRAPMDQEEISFHVQLLQNQGYEAEMDSYVDSLEYEETFGADSVPRFVYRGMYAKNDAFNKMQLIRTHWDGCSTSTKTGSTAPGNAAANKAQFIMPPGTYCTNPYSIRAGIRAGHNPQPDSEKPVPSSLSPINWRAPVRIRVRVADNLYQVFETPAYKPKYDPQWKKERLGPKRWNGVWY